jgi:CcmD family protein
MQRAGAGWRVLLILLLFVTGPTWDAAAGAQQPRPKPAEDEFVPIDQLPPAEQLPAAPLLIAAYSVAWVAVAGYLFSIWRRLDRVDRDIAEAGRRLPRT